MHTVDRNGVHIDQCGRCRGIFLDHGELEAIANAEHRYYAPQMGGRHDSPPPYRGGKPRGYPDSPRPHRGYQDSPGPYRGHGGHGGHGYGCHYGDSPPHYGHSKHGGHRRRKSFLEQLFD